MVNLILILVVYIPAFFLNGKNRSINILLNCFLAITPIIAAAPIIISRITGDGNWIWFVFATAPLGGILAIVIVIIKLVIFLRLRKHLKQG